MTETTYIRGLGYDDDLLEQWEQQNLTPVAAPPEVSLAAAILFTTTPTDRALAGWMDGYNHNASLVLLGVMGGLEQWQAVRQLNTGVPA